MIGKKSCVDARFYVGQGGSVNSALSIGCVNFANKMYNWKKNLAWMHNFMLGRGVNSSNKI